MTREIIHPVELFFFLKSQVLGEVQTPSSEEQASESSGTPLPGFFSQVLRPRREPPSRACHGHVERVRSIAGMGRTRGVICIAWDYHMDACGAPVHLRFVGDARGRRGAPDQRWHGRLSSPTIYPPSNNSAPLEELFAKYNA